ncbi:hypothetical protein IMSAG049_00569 [Clostridiales bacterium]|nr:hypothetical protein IMSAG049_00569 [Clostridiales bacterium]
MHTQRIDIFNKTHGDDIVVRIPHYFQFQFFPAEDGFLHQNLAHQAGLQPSGTHHLQLILIIHKTAAGTAHGVCRAKNHRIPQFLSNRKRFFHRISNLTAGHLNPQIVHGLFKFYAVFSALNSIHLYTDNFDIIFIQNTCLI